ncbi:bifunctional 2-C-methyl-D-erythritol 4-phosphate cytidylyltransferase/2-C-methyl-D-erythritol 2,4-cyclodiphosphate synthase [Novosphingobium sp. KCTC 2891]|uniref:bifunctional 2-C-methyl-D-erythritol 4-phosphate cytidylyltransferase/2-C-methyl-D-erythritol 2,4-cyclodiphosphate synthase n=1 Tax=Novosphingobium sp. KCTC 2891 TaxID=2989730 RepID=UPI002221EED6|nr:bifunctional 2-C-methyl-D-erythritol 4-phosphate cytidylyltransferase/2-C-methyl-D-erythritol 2,4-cyclodiphosphate synthase [Novosphingobium sp. KCTC 2891]MCW1383506.1 bifunctional 2-C-methyl-D-erythritol 4-phosphate cytidylyltransferase/2-C-methyl-D-erythritol 2,4-cyclodiphosphate synthase [Novosphingobium sp. KCTC 2891]
MTPPLPTTGAPIAAVVVAAGKGLRAGGTVPKQFARWRGKPLLRHSVEALAKAGAAPIVVAIPEGWDEEAARVLAGVPGVAFVHGGATRQLSVRAALESLGPHAPGAVLIHDAARPDLPAHVIAGLLAALDEQPGAIPVLPVVDSVVRGAGGLRSAAVSRDELYRVQTPQAFRFGAILAAHRAWPGSPDAGDDAQVAEAAGLAVALVQGDERLRKVTFASDLEEDDVSFALPRTGMGFDVHRLVEDEDLWLCGIKVPHSKGLSGHSDADVAIHALVDALLGAVAAGDIGDHFPPSDPQWKGASSDRFLAHAVSLVRAGGFDIANVDVTIICEAPKIGPHKAAMRERLAAIMGVDADRVSVKATTTERLGLTGRGEGIAAQAVASVVPKGLEKAGLGERV